MKLPTRSLAFLVGGLLLGTALAPVGAQQIAPADGQVAVRSDGAVYLILNGRRHWVATVQITDEELNAYPEGEPIYSGLAPIGSQAGTTTTTTTARVTGSPTTGTTTTGTTTGTTGATTATGATGTGTTTGTTAAATPTATVATTTAGTTSTSGLTSEVDPNLPIDVDIEGPAKFEPGERIIVNVKSKSGAACELTVRWPNGRESTEDTKAIDSRGRCRYSIEIADNAATGVGVLKGTVRDGGRMSREDVEFEIFPKD